MLQKIIAIKNIGRFENSALAGVPSFSKQTFILGANGSGKTTVCEVLRSLKTGNSDHISARKRLGVEHPSKVELLFDHVVIKFEEGAWSDDFSGLEIFDGAFVSENIHSGEIVGTEHKRNLYRVIVGEKGVQWAKEEVQLARRSRETTSEISTVANTLSQYSPEEMSLTDFIDLRPDPDIDARISEQKDVVKALNQSEKIEKTQKLSEYTPPRLSENYRSLLSRSIEDVADHAETILSDHVKAHHMESTGPNWIEQGLEYTDGETCPFCGQDIRELSLIAVYRRIFSEEYKGLRNEIAQMRNRIGDQFGETNLSSWKVTTERNRRSMDFWSNHISLDPANIDDVDNAPNAFHAFGQAALSLLDRKDRAPLDVFDPDAVTSPLPKRSINLRSPE